MKNVDMNNITMMELVLHVNTSALPVIMKMIALLVSPIVTEHIHQTVSVMMDIMMMVLILPFVHNVAINVPPVQTLKNVSLVMLKESMHQLVIAQ